MKFGQLIEYNNRNIFVENHGEIEVERLVPDLFVFYIWLKQVVSSLVSRY